MPHLRIAVLTAVFCVTAAAGAQEPATAPTSEPGGITLQASGVAPEEAFRLLGEQVGATFEPADSQGWADPQRPGAIDLDIVDQPFWLAVKQVCDLSNLELQNDSRPQIRLYSGSRRGLWNDCIIVSSGPVVFIVSAVQRMTKTDLRDPVRVGRQVQIGVQTYIDPRVHVVQGAKPLVVTEAVDDKGQPLKQENVESAGTFQSPWSIHQQIILSMPDEVGSRIVKVGGEANFLVYENTEVLEVKLPWEKPVMRKIGGFPLVLSEVKKEGNSYRVKVTYNRNNGDKAAYARTRSLLSDLVRRVEIRDDSGNVWRTDGSSGSTSESERSYEMHMTRQGDQEGEATMLAWPLPTEVKEMSVPFEFTDLPFE